MAGRGSSTPVPPLPAGEVVWFVHADSRPAPEALTQLRTTLADPNVVGGGCSIRFDRDTHALRYLAWASNRRARWLR
ncbi:MAG: hypothetical protein ACRDRN_24380, partial [Sciscionella sp.]